MNTFEKEVFTLSIKSKGVKSEKENINYDSYNGLKRLWKKTAENWVYNPFPRLKERTWQQAANACNWKSINVQAQVTHKGYCINIILA
ncbi:hypothetical protein [Clostridium tagluense]|uniref:hypothetical protein n=1 Tax=Clostridium tagluense TaxID=360422 RepID=UPI0038512B4D